jgi:tetratricopeptide (TPR) repeat protein
MTSQEAEGLLGLTGTYGTSDIDAAYKKLARKYHPDMHGETNPVIKELLEEKFQQVTNARDLLKSRNDGPRNANAGYSSDSSTDGGQLVQEALSLMEQRRFPAALKVLDRFEREVGASGQIHALRARVHMEMGQNAEAFQSCERAGSTQSDLWNDTEFVFLYAETASQAGKHAPALNGALRWRELSPSDAPLPVQFHALVLIRAGRAAEADQIIRHLATLDPNNELVRERSTVMNVAGTYVNKDDATGAACWACVILECMFDCI